MAKRHPCKRVGLDFVESAPYRFVSTVDLAITPEQLFEVLADETSWPHWASVITKVTWTSPEPRGVGTTRTVEMRGGITGHEEYLVWQPCTRMAFRFNEASTGAIAAFAEVKGARTSLGEEDGLLAPPETAGMTRSAESK